MSASLSISPKYSKNDIKKEKDILWASREEKMGTIPSDQHW